MDQHEKFMRKAIALSVKNLKKGGGPFGAVIVRDGKVIATGVNRVTSSKDPTAHAEITAIRRATRKLGSFGLQGCVLYTSCEPCPMCLAAIYWARIDKVYVSATKYDAAEVGFDDAFIYEEFALPKENRKVLQVPLLVQEGKAPFKAWKQKTDKIPY